MLIRYLPLILVVSAIVLALAPLESAAQTIMGPGIRTEMTPVDREAHNGVFDHKPKSGAAAGLKPSVTLGEVKPVEEPLKASEDVAARYVTQAHPYTTDPAPSGPTSAPADSEPRPKTEGAPVDTHSGDKAVPARRRRGGGTPGAPGPGLSAPTAYSRAGPARRPQAPSRAGVDTQTIPPKDASAQHPEERKDPGG